jgi:hypothetical protein
VWVLRVAPVPRECGGAAIASSGGIVRMGRWKDRRTGRTALVRLGRGVGVRENLGRFWIAAVRGDALEAMAANLGCPSRACQELAHPARPVSDPTYRVEYRQAGPSTQVPRKCKSSTGCDAFRSHTAPPASAGSIRQRRILVETAALQRSCRTGPAWHRGCSISTVRDAPVASYLRACHLPAWPASRVSHRAPWCSQHRGARALSPVRRNVSAAAAPT